MKLLLDEVVGEPDAIKSQHHHGLRNAQRVWTTILLSQASPAESYVISIKAAEVAQANQAVLQHGVWEVRATLMGPSEPPMKPAFFSRCTSVQPSACNSTCAGNGCQPLVFQASFDEAWTRRKGCLRTQAFTTCHAVLILLKV